MARPIHHSSFNIHHSAFTLPELAISIAIMSMLLLAIGSVLTLAGRTVDEGGRSARNTAGATEALEQIIADLNVAIAFTETTPAAVTFTVPDRDGDSQADVVRYAWTGTAGGSLTRSFNNASPLVILEDVKQLKLTYLTKVTAPSPSQADGAGEVSP